MPECILNLEKKSTASERYNITVGQEIEFEINGTVVLKKEVPVGKLWAVHVFVEIIETDA